MKSTTLFTLVLFFGFLAFGGQTEPNESFKERICSANQIEEIESAFNMHVKRLSAIYKKCFRTKKANTYGLEVIGASLTIAGSENPEYLKFNHLVVLRFTDNVSELDQLISKLTERGFQKQDIPTILYYFNRSYFLAFQDEALAKSRGMSGNETMAEQKRLALQLFGPSSLGEKELKKRIKSFLTEQYQVRQGCEIKWVSNAFFHLTKKSRRVLYSYVYEVAGQVMSTFTDYEYTVNAMYDTLYKGVPLSELYERASKQSEEKSPVLNREDKQ